MITGPNKKFDDIFSHVDTIHQRDRQTDRQTDGQATNDSKDRAYAWRRAVKFSLGLGLGLAGLVLFCDTRSCYGRRHNDVEGHRYYAHRNFSSTIYSLIILCLKHHYCGDQE